MVDSKRTVRTFWKFFLTFILPWPAICPEILSSNSANANLPIGVPGQHRKRCGESHARPFILSRPL
jgi:hypothetical protein